MKHSITRGARGFTLIELLAVVTIIIALGGLVIASMSYAKDKQVREQAKVQIALLGTALEEYKLDNGSYPGEASDTPLDGTRMTNEIYKALYWDGASDPDGGKKIYLADLDPENNKQGWITGTGESAIITDPWGNEFRYRKGSNAQNPDFDLWSVGKDGKTQASSNNDKANKDDIRNW